jgi:hypothetical protein
VLALVKPFASGEWQLRRLLARDSELENIAPAGRAQFPGKANLYQLLLSCLTPGTKQLCSVRKGVEGNFGLLPGVKSNKNWLLCYSSVNLEIRHCRPQPAFLERGPKCFNSRRGPRACWFASQRKIAVIAACLLRPGGIFSSDADGWSNGQSGEVIE